MPIDLPYVQVYLTTPGNQYDIRFQNLSSNTQLSDVSSLLADAIEAALKGAYPDWTSVSRKYVDISYTTI